MEIEKNQAAPSIKAHTFEEVISDKSVTFHIMHMNGCLFLWVGDKGCFDSLAVSMTTPYSSLPTTTSLLGLSVEDHSSSLAARLSKKTGKQVFASCSFSNIDESLMVKVTQRLLKELTDNPDKF